ncbi:MAG: chromosome condensation regulator RCC1 [Myxococcales bacterium]|nr:chromosome condensation regulator RCC1 [Myxococcales bacterium]
MSFSEAQATITAGFAHSCALLAEGAVECWGLNDSGQVGDGTTVDRATPTAVTGLTDSAVSILAGGVHTCAQLASGSLSCWGDNSQGQLGNGTTIASATPTAVSGLGGLVQSFSVGQRHSCAVLVGGSVRCWGDNTSGQIGDGTTQDRLVPTEVSGLGAAVNSVSAGDGHSCAVTTGGAVLCWGDNLFGQGGDGSLTSNSVPTPVSGLSAGAVAVATGGLHTCALTTAGAVLCWGDNFFGQVGTAGLGDELTPVTVAGIGGPAQTITTGDSFSCALLVSGALRCWGDNFDGGLGDGSMIDRSTPAEVSGFSSGVVEVELGTFHGCARTDADLLYCWGDNFFGQLGVEATEISLVPIQVLEFNCVETLTTRPLSISLVPQITIGMLLALLGWHLARRRAKRV